MMRNLLPTLLVSTGVPMLTAGDETGRTQRGNNNPYCLDDETSWLSWAHAPWQQDLHAWTRALLDLRRKHPVLRHDDFFEGRPARPDGTKDVAWFGDDGHEMSAERWFQHDLRVLGVYLSGKAVDDADEPDPSLLVLLNTGRAERRDAAARPALGHGVRRAARHHRRAARAGADPRRGRGGRAGAAQRPGPRRPPLTAVQDRSRRSRRHAARAPRNVATILAAGARDGGCGGG